MGPVQRGRRSDTHSSGRSTSRDGDRLGAMLAEVRRIIREADPEIVEERKWKKPTNPAGVPVWSHHGIICIANELKGRLRLTFADGASLKDPKHRFNARLDSKTVRAIDIPEGESIDEGALKAWIRGAAAINSRQASATR